ncbi:hypothetical protein CLI85_07200 [Tannerella forsythia]|nr:hypothetical protein CLI85_07200 [Tannerella forsythia]
MQRGIPPRKKEILRFALNDKRRCNNSTTNTRGATNLLQGFVLRFSLLDRLRMTKKCFLCRKNNNKREHETQTFIRGAGLYAAICADYFFLFFNCNPFIDEIWLKA